MRPRRGWNVAAPDDIRRVARHQIPFSQPIAQRQSISANGAPHDSLGFQPQETICPHPPRSANGAFHQGRFGWRGPVLGTSACTGVSCDAPSALGIRAGRGPGVETPGYHGTRLQRMAAVSACPAMHEDPEPEDPEPEDPGIEDPSAIFPWEDLEACRKKRRRRSRALDEALERYGPEAKSCPKCNRPGKDLRWIHFSSPAWTWDHLCGREGATYRKKYPQPALEASPAGRRRPD